MSERIFVFASNCSSGPNTGGVHGAGSAKEAREYHGAKYGVGVGRTGNAYAIPTKRHLGYINHKHRFDILTVEEISVHVNNFIQYAKEHPELTFDVVKIGCGLAGHNERAMATLFLDAPMNCNLPAGWR